MRQWSRHKLADISSYEQNTKLKFVQPFCNSIAEISAKFDEKIFVKNPEGKPN